MGPAHVEWHTGGAQVRAGDAQGDGVPAGQDAHADGACAEHLVVGDHPLAHVDRLDHVRPPRAQAREELVVGVEVDAAHAKEVEEHPLAADGRQQVDHLVAVDEAVEDRGDAAHVESQEAHHQAVAEDPVQLHHQRTDVLGAPGRLDSEQLLEGDRRGMLVVHRGEVVHRVDVGHDGGIGGVLAQLLDAAMQVPEHRVNVDHDLATHLGHEAHHAVGRGVLRAHVDQHLALGEGIELPLALGVRWPIRQADRLESGVLAAGAGER